MAQELGWSYSQRCKQIAMAVQFLGSMGLNPTLMVSSNIPEPIPKTWVESLEKKFWKVGRSTLTMVGLGSAEVAAKPNEYIPGRSKFEGGEVATLRNAFGRRTKSIDGDEKVRSDEILNILKEIPGYSEISQKEVNYVIDEAGMRDGVVNFDEFIEVCFVFL